MVHLLPDNWRDLLAIESSPQMSLKVRPLPRQFESGGGGAESYL
jgi:hypothetical protein